MTVGDLLENLKGRDSALPVEMYTRCGPDSVDSVVTGERSVILESSRCCPQIMEADCRSREIAELRKHLHEAIKRECTECHETNDYESDITVEWQMCRDCPVKIWRDAVGAPFR